MENKRLFKIRYFEYEDDNYNEKVLDDRKLMRIFGNDAKYILHKIETESKAYLKGDYVREEFTADLVDGILVRYEKGYGSGKYNVQERNGKYIYKEESKENIAKELKLPVENIISYEFIKEDNRGYQAHKIYNVRYFTNDYLVELGINQIIEAVLDFDDVQIIFDKNNVIWLDNEKIYTLIMKVN